jgi:hypothetical protein
MRPQTLREIFDEIPEKRNANFSVGSVRNVRVKTFACMITEIKPTQTIYQSGKNLEIQYRHLKIADSTFDGMTLVLWRKKAEEAEVEVGDCVLVQNCYARWNVHRNECQIDVNEFSVVRSIVKREIMRKSATVGEVAQKCVPVERNLGTTDDSVARDFVLRVCAWAMQEKVDLISMQVREDDDGSRRRRSRSAFLGANISDEEKMIRTTTSPRVGEDIHQKKKFKRTLMKNFVGVVVDHGQVRSSMGDAENGQYVRPVLTMTRRPVDRERNEKLLQRRLTLTSSPVLAKLKTFNNISITSPTLKDCGGDDASIRNNNEDNFVEVTLSAMSKRDAKDLLESVYKIGRCVELEDFAIAELVPDCEFKAIFNASDASETVKKLVFVDNTSIVRVLDPKKDSRAQNVVVIVGETHRRLSFEVEKVAEIFEDMNERNFHDVSDNYDEEDERIYGRELVEKKRKEKVKLVMEARHKKLLSQRSKEQINVMSETQITRTYSIADIFESANRYDSQFHDGLCSKRNDYGVLPPFVEFKAVVNYIEIERRGELITPSNSPKPAKRKLSITNPNATKSTLSSDGVLRIPGLKNGTKSVSEIASELIEVACSKCGNALRKGADEIYEFCKLCPTDLLKNNSRRVHNATTKNVFKPLIFGLEDASGDVIRGKIPSSMVREILLLQNAEDISDSNPDPVKRNISETTAVGLLRALMAGKRNTPFSFTAKMPKLDENGWIVRANEIDIVKFVCPPLNN